MSPKREICDTFQAYGIADDTSRECGAHSPLWRHVGSTKVLRGRDRTNGQSWLDSDISIRALPAGIPDGRFPQRVDFIVICGNE
jgi:hypothetical protein